jgi:hypothetical protein
MKMQADAAKYYMRQINNNTTNRQVRQLECAYRHSLKYIVVKSRCLSDHGGSYTHADLVLRSNEEEALN